MRIRHGFLLALLAALAAGGMAACRHQAALPAGPAKTSQPSGGETAQAEASKTAQTEQKPLKLYWLIPDGLRAEPDLFKIFQWAREGRLPHLKKLMEQGAFGYSQPVFPSHTPVNFATLLTGTTPDRHGVADGPMHTEGHKLSKVSVGGFSSTARKIPAIWSYIDQKGFKSAIISVPGSTPPEITNGLVIRGRWGGWGRDIAAINFELKTSQKRIVSQGHAARLFYFGPKLTQFIGFSGGQALRPASLLPAKQFKMTAWGKDFYGAVIDSGGGKIQGGYGKSKYSSPGGYDRIVFAREKGRMDASLRQGGWSQWLPVRLKVKGLGLDSAVKFHVIALRPDGFFRVRLLFNSLNRTVVFPSHAAADLNKNLGPMTDFADNFPPQLIYFNEDKKTFLDELHFSFDWHVSLIPYLRRAKNPEFVIHDIYSPNQMLTSRWWLGSVDPASRHYSKTSEKERKEAWADILGMYKRVDDMLGEILKIADKNTVIAFSSDHGAAPLNQWVHLNNLFAREGLLKFSKDPQTGLNVIDWPRTKAVYLKMDGVFIHPEGLGGPWKRGHGPEYEKLRSRIERLLNSLKNERGEKIIAKIARHEDAAKTFKLPPDRTGDLIIANKPGYGWSEAVSGDLKIFSDPLKSGYKQAILPHSEKSMWTPFVISGPGVKKGFQIKKPLSHEDQLPAILKALDTDLKVKNITGNPINEIFN